MKVINSLNEADRPQPPEGYRYSCTISWDTNRVNLVPGTQGVHKIVMLPSGLIIADGDGPLQVCCELPAKVHVYTELGKL